MIDEDDALRLFRADMAQMLKADALHQKISLHSISSFQTPCPFENRIPALSINRLFCFETL